MPGDPTIRPAPVTTSEGRAASTEPSGCRALAPAPLQVLAVYSQSAGRVTLPGPGPPAASLAVSGAEGAEGSASRRISLKKPAPARASPRDGPVCDHSRCSAWLPPRSAPVCTPTQASGMLQQSRAAWAELLMK